MASAEKDVTARTPTRTNKDLNDVFILTPLEPFCVRIVINKIGAIIRLLLISACLFYLIIKKSRKWHTDGIFEADAIKFASYYG